MRNVGYYNGEIGLIEEMSVSMLDCAVYFGDGVYDVSVVLDGVPFALDDHLDRFFRCCGQLEMKRPAAATRRCFPGSSGSTTSISARTGKALLMPQSLWGAVKCSDA